MHDGILVGVGTLKSDDPQLNGACVRLPFACPPQVVLPPLTLNGFPIPTTARLLNPLPSGEAPSLASLPRPIVLDTSLLTPLEAKILANHAAGTGARPLLVTSVGGAHAARAGWAERRAALTEAGAEILEVPSSATDAAQLDWKAVLAALDGAGIKRLMVEGGASVISSLLCAHSASSDEPLIDTLIVTISRQALGAGESYVAPTWLARTLLPGSVKTSRRGKARALLSKTPSAEPFGMDFVLAWGGGAPPSAAQATVRVGETVLEEGDGVFVRQARVGETLEIENLSARDAEM
jgi:riboflavin biosynthesis pyrimidine reductase